MAEITVNIIPKPKRRFIKLLSVFFVASIFTHNFASAENYKLGIQDKLRIHVSEWPALIGEFSVGASGDVSLPIIGQIHAAGLETRELAEAIALKLRDKVKLRDLPDAAVDIVSYRPFYVLGQVTTPGEYSYRPGMVVLNALSLAGGIYRSQRGSEWAVESSTINTIGELTLLQARKYDLNAEDQRLQLEASGAEIFSADTDDTSLDYMKALDEQRLLFEAGLQRFKDEGRSLRSSLAIHQRELESLDAQIAVSSQNLVAAKKELDTVRNLTDRGLASNRVYPMERSVAEVEQELGDLRISRLRAERDMNEVNGELMKLESTRKSGALGGIQRLKTQMREIAKQEESLKTLLRTVSSYSSDLAEPETQEVLPTLTYTIVRTINDKIEQIAATEIMRVEPGDIIKVERLMPKTPPKTASRANIATHLTQRTDVQEFISK
jgi:protein involved in polysaccharide export with SLBB domain